MINRYPYTDAHELNLDYILKKIKELNLRVDDFEALNTIVQRGAWSITEQYTAWSVVFDNNIGYISIRPVPAGIDIHNTDYWREICSINALENRRFIFIGDSYGEQSSFTFDVWSTIVPATLGLVEGTDYFKKCVSGSGFCGGTIFRNLLASIEAEVTDKQTITDIYVFGGINDNSYSQSQIETNIRSFMTYAKSTYPNARVTIGHISNTTDGTGQFNMSEHTLPAYLNAGQYGAAYAPLNNVLANYELLGADGTHPTQDGQIVLAGAIVENILGNAVYTRTRSKLTLTMNAAGSFYPADANKVNQYEENGFYKMYFDFSYVTINFDNVDSFGPSFGTLLRFSDNTKGCYPRGLSQSIPCYYKVKTSGTWQTQIHFGALQYDGPNNKINFRTDYETLSGIEGLEILGVEWSCRSFSN